MEMIPRITRAQKVEAFDTRPVVEVQVKSLGARFVKIDLGETGQTKDGYAKALTDEQLQKQREGMAKVCAASDVVNPAAREVASSPIYGMPIFDADNAKTVLVLKRSMAAGFSGVDNPLFVKENTRMLFGDAKATVQQLVAEFKES
ncbi:MAG: NAD(P)(+) transhydrogenase (Re/Si-specific) subunit beta [Desulfobacterales bacterium]|nr:MAG: NAD(P)(+) transhydrogenase (Re/Si-specific) subunit beta [Desulfobacterales bacterium]